jgi:dipeptidyl aminopeptidase/acylaminoacyl peptidase
VRHEESGASRTIDVRAFDDGIAFRSVVPGPAGKRRVPDESTAFRLPVGTTVWFHDFESHHEGVHQKYAIQNVPGGAWAITGNHTTFAWLLGAAVRKPVARAEAVLLLPKVHAMKPSFLALLPLFTCGVLAQQKWTVDDILMAERGDQFRLSRDGRLAVWVKSQMDRDKGESVSHLFLRNLADNFEVQLTRGTDSHSSPRFSPDGRRIAFLTSRKASGAPGGAGGDSAGETGPQVWLIDSRGGEPWQLTRFEKGVRQFDWLDDNTLLLAAPEDPSLHAQKIKERKDTSEVVDDEKHAPPVRLFRFDLKTKTATRLTENTDRIQSLVVSADGAWAVTVHERSLHYIYDQEIEPVTFLHDLKKGTAKQLFAGGKLLPGRFSWSPDNGGFYFSAPFTTHPKYHNAAIQLLYYFDLAAGRETQVNLDWENGLAMGFGAVPGGVLALVANGVRPRAALYMRDGSAWKRSWVESEHAGNIFGLETGGDGKTVLYDHSTASVPEQWYAAQLEGSALKNAKPITDLNPGLKKKTIAKTEPMRWKGARGEEVEGMLYYPHNYEAGKKYPLVVMIHGGPAGADMDNFSERMSYPHNLMAQRGAFVFKPNYHGSSEYGLKWLESIGGGNYNELEWIDVETGVDSLIARGLVDPERLGVMGWSNGSIITIELTTRTTRYKAASAGAGDVNWISDWGNAVFGRAFDDYYLGKSPLEDPQFYVKKSPLFRMDKVRTPTIIFFGTEDKQVPTEQGWQHYRALQQLGKTDVKFILFPGEAHGPRKLVHQRRKLEEEMAWFDKYLFKTTADSNEALKPESPLAAALKKKAAGNVPETVPRGEIEIGRFEVTRAQYAAFDPKYRVEPGTADYPATGVSFDDARRYCEWLSAATGRKYRLGTEAEMEPFLKAGKGENTLDYWAGYPVNADDAKLLTPSVEGLGPGALLRPVGSFHGNGDDPIFDLGGNAAEWVVTQNGAGKASGGSADRPLDPKSTARPRADYIGFRVVKETK